MASPGDELVEPEEQMAGYCPRPIGPALEYVWQEICPKKWLKRAAMNLMSRVKPAYNSRWWKCRSVRIGPAFPRTHLQSFMINVCISLKNPSPQMDFSSLCNASAFSWPSPDLPSPILPYMVWKHKTMQWLWNKGILYRYKICSSCILHDVHLMLQVIAIPSNSAYDKWSFIVKTRLPHFVDLKIAERHN